MRNSTHPKLTCRDLQFIRTRAYAYWAEKAWNSSLLGERKRRKAPGAIERRPRSVRMEERQEPRSRPLPFLSSVTEKAEPE